MYILKEGDKYTEANFLGWWGDECPGFSTRASKVISTDIMCKINESTASLSSASLEHITSNVNKQNHPEEPYNILVKSRSLECN